MLTLMSGATALQGAAQRGDCMGATAAAASVAVAAASVRFVNPPRMQEDEHLAWNIIRNPSCACRFCYLLRSMYACLSSEGVSADSWVIPHMATAHIATSCWHEH